MRIMNSRRHPLFPNELVCQQMSLGKSLHFCVAKAPIDEAMGEVGEEETQGSKKLHLGGWVVCGSPVGLLWGGEWVSLKLHARFRWGYGVARLMMAQSFRSHSI